MSYLAPRNRPSVLAFAGDSTMISGFAMSGSGRPGDRSAVADYIAAHFQQCQAPTHFLDVKVHRGRQVIMMAGFYPIKQLPNGKELRFLRSRVRARAYAREVGKFVQHILNGLHQLGPVFDELVPTDGEWILDTPRDAKHLASLLRRHAGGDQRAASLRRLDYHDAEAEAADDAIANREPSGQGQRAVLGLGNHRARRRDRLRHLGMRGWIHPVEPGRNHGNGWTLPLQCAAMRRRIAPTGQPAHDDHP